MINSFYLFAESSMPYKNPIPEDARKKAMLTAQAMRMTLHENFRLLKENDRPGADEEFSPQVLEENAALITLVMLDEHKDAQTFLKRVRSVKERPTLQMY